MRSLLASLMLLVASPALAGSIAVVTESAEGPLPDSTFRSVVWHALYDEFGHDAVFFDSLDPSTVDAMHGTTMTTLLHLRVSWRADSVRIDQDDGDFFLVGGHYPVIETTEYALEPEGLAARFAWHTEGPVSVYEVRSEGPQRFISLPEVSLQETTTLALQPTHAPVWSAEPDWINVPVIVAADDEYRAFYGEAAWQKVAGRAVDRANALLRHAGVRLAVQGHQGWTSPAGLTDLSDLLESLSIQDMPAGGAIRIGFTAQTRLAVDFQALMEDVGRAYLPGRDVIIADQAVNPGHDPTWDVAEEGVAVAHEVLHALGIPHLEQGDRLMSATKRGTVHAMADSTIELTRTAAASRYTHWDTNAALTALSQVAQAHLSDPDVQLDYIADNLAYGPGVPAPGSLEPGQLSALTNVAMGRYYLRIAQENPTDAWQFRLGAKAHVESALAQEPAWREARQLQRLVQAAQRGSVPQPVRPPDDPQPTLDEMAEAVYPSVVPDTRTCPITDLDPTCE